MPKQPAAAEGGSTTPPKKRKSKLQLDLETLRNYFKMPLYLAAERLGVSTTTLKAKCREFGLARWPHLDYLREQMMNRSKISAWSPEEDGGGGSEEKAEQQASHQSPGSQQASASLPHDCTSANQPLPAGSFQMPFSDQLHTTTSLAHLSSEHPVQHSWTGTFQNAPQMSPFGKQPVPKFSSSLFPNFTPTDRGPLPSAVTPASDIVQATTSSLLSNFQSINFPTVSGAVPGLHQAGGLHHHVDFPQMTPSHQAPQAPVSHSTLPTRSTSLPNFLSSPGQPTALGAPLHGPGQSPVPPSDASAGVKPSPPSHSNFLVPQRPPSWIVSVQDMQSQAAHSLSCPPSHDSESSHSVSAARPPSQRPPDFGFPNGAGAFAQVSPGSNAQQVLNNVSGFPSNFQNLSRSWSAPNLPPSGRPAPYGVDTSSAFACVARSQSSCSGSATAGPGPSPGMPGSGVGHSGGAGWQLPSEQAGRMGIGPEGSLSQRLLSGQLSAFQVGPGSAVPGGQVREEGSLSPGQAEARQQLHRAQLQRAQLQQAQLGVQIQLMQFGQQMLERDQLSTAAAGHGDQR